ncbi:MAG: hypothetical protein WDZ59_17405 [Pirellulales bacterium]
MSERRSFVRKVVYLCAIGLLLVPVSWLSAPATRSSVSGQGSSGGKLARLRADYKLSQANLGEIDPASETIKLATLGMRGIAANLLWEKANHYKMTEDWTNFSATLEQITKLQPNFVSVWQYQAWNLSYNVSYEFDDYRDRYYWVMRGIDFLEDGTRYNENDPQLLWDMGWFLGYKIGRADEHVLYRRLFKDDEEYHPADRPREMRDNWLLGKQWFRKAQYAVDNFQKEVEGRTDLIFHSYPALWQMYYAATIESEGVFGEVARRAWATAAEDWQQFGERIIPMYDNTIVQLGRLDYYRQEVERNHQQLNALAPGLADAIQSERRQRLTDAQRRVLAIPIDERSTDQRAIVNQLAAMLQVTPHQLAGRIQQLHPEKAVEAHRLADALQHANVVASNIERSRPDVNYDYWKMRAEFEQTDDALLARELIHKGSEAFAAADPDLARELYEQGLQKWRAILDAYPGIVSHGITGDELMRIIEQYVRILNQNDAPIPADFPLRQFVEYHDDENRIRGLLPPVSESPDTSTDGSSEEASETDSRDGSGGEDSPPTAVRGTPPSP